MRERTLEWIYGQCIVGGAFIPLDKVDQHKIKTMLDLALSDFWAVKEILRHTAKDSGGWNIIYKLYYDIIHSLVEAFVRFDKVKVKTHECLFAYLCQKHPELELNLDFFEKIRTKRNGSVYYGQPATLNDWKAIEVQMNLYIDLFKKRIEEKLKEEL